MSPLALPVPSLVAPSASKPVPSNTIIITSLPPSFFHVSLQTSLRAHFASYGPLSAWISLAGLGRILAVYQDPEAARLSKIEMDRFVIEGCELEENQDGSLDITEEERELVKNLPRTVFRVYFGPSTPLAKLDAPTIITNDDLIESDRTDAPQHNLLKPPALDKNFLISPPGSPPVGWEQVVEDAPNQASLAEDLCQRLRFLSVGNEEDEGEAGDEEGEAGEIVVLQAQPGLKLPALKIQHSERIAQRPGMDIGLVKATLESMVSNRISPTPRPALSSSS